MMFTIEADYLQKCPFCGADAKIKVVEHPIKTDCILARVECSKCHARTVEAMTGKIFSENQEYVTLTEAVGKAVNSWNARKLNEVTA